MATIGASVDDETYQKAKQIAEENHTSVSQIVKASFGGIEVKDKSLALQILNELSAIGNNLNQISKRCNIKKSVDIQTLKSLTNIEQQLKEFIDVS